jgi:glyoxylase-like metal-dependent hydrolase (beta-lactamase superfamily II)
MSPTSGFEGFERVCTDEPWFEVYRVASDLFVIHEPRHYEGTTITLILGTRRALLVDTGCGIGNLRPLVERLTTKPVLIVNTHTHLDHLGANHQFHELAMFDHPTTRQIAENGVPATTYRFELLHDGLVQGPWPIGFDPVTATLRPFTVTRWLRDGDQIDIGGSQLEVLFTPGEAVDNICLLDRSRRVLCSSDILLLGGVWSHLPGGNVRDLAASYRRLMQHYGDFDRIMPSHGQPWLGKDLLPEMLAGAEAVLSGTSRPCDFTDPWGRHIRKYDFDRFNIQTR